jgi:hypothetical protein
MATERKRQLLLGAVVAVLAFAVYWMWPGTSAAPVPSSNQRVSRANTAAEPASPAIATLDVHLKALGEERTKPARGERNLFRFKSKTPPPAPVRAQPAMPVAVEPAGPPPPPPVPPIQLKFIGVIERDGQTPKIAVLSDSVGHVSSGAEGEVIDGRYRIVKIGVESIEMMYLDGRGRQTIRLTGS